MFETQIDPAELQAGDRVRFVNDAGSEITGTVTRQGGMLDCCWFDADNMPLICTSQYGRLYLVQRPVPTDVGTVFKITQLRGEEGEWLCVVGFPIFDGDESIYQIKSEGKSSADWVRADAITRWEPLPNE